MMDIERYLFLSASKSQPTEIKREEGVKFRLFNTKIMKSRLSDLKQVLSSKRCTVTVCR